MKIDLSRRSFLRNSALASLWTAGGCAGFPAIVSSRSPNAKLCHACIGVHNMAESDMKRFLANPDVRVTAICDVDRNYLERAKKLAPDARVYTDWRELLAAEGNRLDSINVSTPDHTHTAPICAALRAGKHVYSQKPLCKYLDESDLIRRLAAESGTVTQLGTQIAASVCDRTAVAALRLGLIGPVKRIILFSTRRGSSRVARKIPVPRSVPATLDWERWIGPAPMRPYAEGYHPLLWRMYTDFGTGWVGDLCIHVISAVWQGLDLGANAPVSMTAKVNAEAMVDPAYKGCWPRYSHITWNYDGIPATAMKPFSMEWVSGFSEDPATPAEFLPPSVCDIFLPQMKNGKLPTEGRVIEGETGWMLVPHAHRDYPQPILAMKSGRTAPELPSVGEAPSHFDEYVRCCREGGRARSDFLWAAHMSDAVLLGGACERFPDRTLHWDSKTRTIDDAEANAALHSNYRDGWKVKGLC